MAITVCRGASRRIPRRPDPDIGLDGASTNLQHPVCSCCNLDCLCPLGWWRCLKMLAVGYTPSISLLRPSCGTENSFRQSIRLPSVAALGSERPACEFSAPGHWSSLPNFATEKTWIFTEAVRRCHDTWQRVCLLSMATAAPRGALRLLAVRDKHRLAF